MKKFLCIFSLIFLSTVLFSQEDYEIVGAYASPSTLTGDLTNDGEYIYLRGGSERDKIYKIDPSTGLADDVITLELSTIDGITYGAGHLWVGGFDDPSQQIIYKLNPITEEVVDTIYHTYGDYTHGMAFHDNQLVINMFQLSGTDITYILDLEGNVIESHNNGLSFSHGLEYDGCNYWLTANSFPDPNGKYEKFIRYDTNVFTRLDTFDTPGGRTPLGLTYLDGFLWVSENENDSIYKLKFYDELITDVVIEGDTLMALEDNATYKWLDCDNDFEIIDGEFDQMFIPSDYGNYAVEVRYGCRDTSECVAYLPSNNFDQLQSQTKIYPNPSVGIYQVSSIPTNSNIQVFTNLGELIFFQEVTDESSIIDISEYENGFYYVLVGNKTIHQSFKLLKVGN